MKEIKRKKLEDVLGEEATSMLNNTSCLAIGNIFIRNHPLLKTLWCIAFILCTILTIRQLYSLSNSYFSYPLSTVIRLQSEPIDFPSITFCNLNPLRYSRINLSKPNLQLFFSNLEKRQFIKDNNNEMVSRLFDENEYIKLILNETSNTRTKMGHQLKDLVLQCSFLGEKCDMEKLFTPLLSNKYGNCYTFNPYKHYNRSSIMSNGSRNKGLFITFYLQNDEYLKNFIPSSGIRIHFQEPGSVEIPESFGMNLPPGFEISLGIIPTKIRRLIEIKDNCDEGILFTKEYKSTYTRQACQYVCLQNMIFQKCQCYDASFQLYTSKAKSLICNSDSKINCLLQTIYEFNDHINACNCNIACNTTIYTIRQSFAEWPANSYEKRFFNDLKDIYPKFDSSIINDKNKARQNLSNVLIYVEDRSYQEIYQIRAYKWDNFLSDIGGTLSLYLGFSVLTGFEFLEAISLITTYVCTKVMFGKTENKT